jgi:sugar phosphate isomerase/epimerase
MDIAVATDFAGSTGDPDLSLRALAEAGFASLHWCHHWCDDFHYGKHELAYIKSLLKQYHLRLLDIHGSQGVEKCWNSTVEYRRREGVDLVANRIRMLRELDGTGTVMMHVPHFGIDTPEADRPGISQSFDALCRSIDELMPLLDSTDTLIAVENMWRDSWETIEALLARYPANRIGICYDAGHANANCNKRLETLAKNKGRLEALHLHDNNGEGDQHQPPFYGTVDWPRLADILATSSYSREISFELSMTHTPFLKEGLEPGVKQPYENRLAFARDAFERCSRFARQVADARQAVE